MRPNNTQIRLVVVALVVLLVVIGAGVLIGRIGKKAIKLTVLPTYASVTIDGKKVSTRTTVYLKEGTHTIIASAAEFVAESRDFSTNTLPYLDMSLLPSSDKGKQWAERNENLYTAMQARAEKAVVSTGQELASRYPIVDELPYTEEDSFKIGFVTPDGTADSFVLTIHADSSLGRATALAQIRRWGYNPSEYVIRYVGFTNPLSTEGAQ